MYGKFKIHLEQQIESIRESGLYKHERVMTSPQSSRVTVADKQVLNMCANNYLGLADHPEIVQAAKDSLDRWGYGMASVRFICGTQTIHSRLELALSDFLETEATILYSSCFDANGGLFETLLGAEDAVISDELNHASIIDGIRLCKATRLRYKHADMADLEAKLKEAHSARFRMIATDGVFSMDGDVAPLADICRLAEHYGAMVMVDDSHAVGVLGAKGRGSIEHCGVMGKVDIVTGTLGKALGGASGGYTSGRVEIIALLRQQSRPYLFSNTVAPTIVSGTLKALEMMSRSADLRQKLMENTQHFRQGITRMGFHIRAGEHPIVPIMLGEAGLAQHFAAHMLEKGVYVVGFFYPVVPQGSARIRVQLSAAHSKADLDMALEAFAETGKELEML